MAVKYELADFLVKSGITPAQYRRWLSHKAAAHCKRDRRRCQDKSITISDYKQRIHDAVCKSNGRDWYTGEELDWGLLSKFDNTSAKAGRSEYKSKFTFLPTVDHVPGVGCIYDFVICSWRTNDAKSDLSYEDFVELCRKVIAHHDKS